MNRKDKRSMVDQFRDAEFVVPRGFRAGSLAAGIKPSGRPDLVIFAADHPCPTAGLFTRSLYPAAPVQICREHLAQSPTAQAVILNAGNANACTGEDGLARARRMVAAGAALAGCAPHHVLPMSTGVIGRTLPVEKIEVAVPALKAAMSDAPEAFYAAAHAMMTTDAFAKWASAEIMIEGRRVRLLGLAKGAGMIHPDMATMLVMLMTDAAIPPDAIRPLLCEVSDASFHCLTVDGDTSTNDTVVLMANGEAGHAPLNPGHGEWGVLQIALAEVCKSLARQMAADGEGAKHLMQITVTGARDAADARRVAMTVALSPLCKTAVCGNDPNWGRIVAAAGRSGVQFDPNQLSLTLGPIPLFAAGAPLEFDAKAASGYMRDNARVDIDISLGAGPGEITVWASDLTTNYVRINSEYTT